MKKIIAFVFLFLFTSIPPLLAHPVVSNCDEHELVVFNCDTKSKRLSVCLMDEPSSGKVALQYKFGRSTKSELIYPDKENGSFYLSHFRDTKSREDRLRFIQGEDQYIVYSFTSAKQGNKAGVLVIKGNKTISNTVCTGIDEIEPWPIRIPKSLVKEEEFNPRIELP